MGKGDKRKNQPHSDMAQPTEQSEDELKWRRQHGELPGERAVLRRASRDGGLEGVGDLKGNPIIRQRGDQSDVLDAKGERADPVKVYDTLKRLRMANTIDDAEYEAGRQFEADFRKAAHDGLQAFDMERIPGQAGGEMSEEQATHITAARRRIWDTVQQLGGITDPLAAVVWDVLGLGLTIGQHAERSRFARPQTITALLITALHKMARCVAVTDRKGRIRKWREE